MRDAEGLLRRARRPLVVGRGGGGDVVEALATAEFTRLYDGAEPMLGGLSWERRTIDPVPGPRTAAEIEDARELAPGVMLAGETTRVRDREVFFAESRMAEFLGEPTARCGWSRTRPAVRRCGCFAAARERPRSVAARGRSSSPRALRSLCISTSMSPSTRPAVWRRRFATQGVWRRPTRRCTNWACGPSSTWRGNSRLADHRAPETSRAPDLGE